jgi:hypothetical protein
MHLTHKEKRSIGNSNSRPENPKLTSCHGILALSKNRQPFTCIIIHVLEIHDHRIIVIRTGKEGAREVGWVDVGEWVVGVPPPKTEVEPVNAGEVAVDYDLQKVWLGVGREERSMCRPKLKRISSNNT